MSRRTISITEFDPTLIGFGPVKKNQAGGNFVPLNYNGELVDIQLPLMRVPFGASGNTKEIQQTKPGQPRQKPRREDIVSYTVDLSFDDMSVETDDNAEMRLFHQKLQQLDEHIKKAAQANPAAWFGKPKLTAETIDSFYRSNIKQSLDKETRMPDGKYPDRFQIKIGVNSGKINTQLYTPGGELINMYPDDIINKGARIIALVRPKSLWFVGGTQFGMKVEPVQMVVIPSANNGNRLAISVPAAIASVKVELAELSGGGAAAAGAIIHDSDDHTIAAEVAPAVAAAAPAIIDDEADEEDDTPPPPRRPVGNSKSISRPTRK
jgi:hypothetical protein